MMPEIDGIQLAEQVRKLYPNLPIFLFSSIGRTDISSPELFTNQLNKPLKPSSLFDALISLFPGDILSRREEGPAPTEKPSASALLADQHPLRILVAEDNPVNQKLALRILSQMGYRADIAGNGLEVLQSLERQTYDVILMDVQMPEMDGLEATRQIQSLRPRGQSPYIIAMTANAMQGDREMCLAAGMNDYLSKPIRVNELATALQRCHTSGLN